MHARMGAGVGSGGRDECWEPGWELGWGLGWELAWHTHGPIPGDCDTHECPIPIPAVPGTPECPSATPLPQVLHMTFGTDTVVAEGRNVSVNGAAVPEGRPYLHKGEVPKVTTLGQGGGEPPAAPGSTRTR